MSDIPPAVPVPDSQPAQPAPIVKSPLWEAYQARRYARQDFIRGIEEQTGRRLIVYAANVNHRNASLGQVDVAPLQDLLSDCPLGCDLDLLLQTPGGDIDVAEKLVYMIRERAESFRLIVVERAKSAGTLIALAADELLMGTTSELGPIDPQITTYNSDGRPMMYAAHSFLDGIESIKQKVVDEGGINPAYYPLLSQLDPALLDYCQKAIARSQQFAEKWLKKHMLAHDPGQAETIARLLVADKSYIASHGKVIDWEEASDLGLNVTHLDADDPLWQRLWRLFVEYEIEFQSNGHSKLFESRKVSLAYG